MTTLRQDSIAKENDARFKDFVACHLAKIPTKIWNNFRLDENHISKRDLINEALTRGGLTITETLECLPDHKEIGALGKNPVYFSQIHGMYVWEPDTQDDPFVREICLFHPYLPPRWISYRYEQTSNQEE